MIDTAPSPVDLRASAELLHEYGAPTEELYNSYQKVADMLEALIPLAEHLAKMEEAGVDPSAALPAFLRQLGV